MKDFIKSAFSMHFAMVFMSFIIFSTQKFTLGHPIINVIASVIVTGIYLVLFYTDAFKITTVNIRNGKKTVTPVLSWILLYIIPCLLLVWLYTAPMEYGEYVQEKIETSQIVSEDTSEQVTEETESSEDSEITEEPKTKSVYRKTGLRQQAWFELYMQPYKGIYHLAGNTLISYIITLLLMPLASILGYINALRGNDVMKKAEKKFRNMVYRQEDEL